jgi:ribosomal protein S18 acetylase RimI-like enzyme
MKSPLSIVLVEPKTEEDLEKYYRLRYEVLRKPWNQPFASTMDETENESIHILIKDDSGNALAAGRLQFNSSEQGQLRSMAVHSDYQGKGLGNKLIQELERIAKSKGMKEIILDARENAVVFYKANGYEIIAPSYLLFGVIPHFVMQKNL